MAQGKESDAAAAENLRLIALDAEDLAVLAAHLQDAILRVGDMIYLPDEQRFVLALNRFDWLSATTGAPQRAQTGLHFEKVLKVAIHGFHQDRPDDISESAQYRLYAGRGACGDRDFDLFRRLRVAARSRMSRRTHGRSRPALARPPCAGARAQSLTYPPRGEA